MFVTFFDFLSFGGIFSRWLHIYSIPSIANVGVFEENTIVLIPGDSLFCDCWAVSGLTLKHEDSTVHNISLT